MHMLQDLANIQHDNLSRVIDDLDRVIEKLYGGGAIIEKKPAGLPPVSDGIMHALGERLNQNAELLSILSKRVDELAAMISAGELPPPSQPEPPGTRAFR